MRRAVRKGGPSRFLRPPPSRPGAARSHRLAAMSVIAIVAIAIGAVLLLLFVGGFVAARRRASHPDVVKRIRAGDGELVEGLSWGKPRKAHPEGAVGQHVAGLLREIDRSGESGERRALLRFIALVHDSFKNKVIRWLPRTGENHHAMRARRFAE